MFNRQPHPPPFQGRLGRLHDAKPDIPWAAAVEAVQDCRIEKERVGDAILRRVLLDPRILQSDSEEEVLPVGLEQSGSLHHTSSDSSEDPLFEALHRRHPNEPNPFKRDPHCAVNAELERSVAHLNFSKHNPILRPANFREISSIFAGIRNTTNTTTTTGPAPTSPQYYSTDSDSSIEVPKKEEDVLRPLSSNGSVQSIMKSESSDDDGASVVTTLIGHIDRIPTLFSLKDSTASDAINASLGLQRGKSVMTSFMAKTAQIHKSAPTAFVTASSAAQMSPFESGGARRGWFRSYPKGCVPAVPAKVKPPTQTPPSPIPEPTTKPIKKRKVARRRTLPAKSGVSDVAVSDLQQKYNKTEKCLAREREGARMREKEIVRLKTHIAAAEQRRRRWVVHEAQEKARLQERVLQLEVQCGRIADEEKAIEAQFTEDLFKRTPGKNKKMDQL